MERVWYIPWSESHFDIQQLAGNTEYDRVALG